MTDVGGNLLRALERSNVAWEPLLRSNTVNIHRLWFGVYSSIVSHHGAGFRLGISVEERRRIEKRAAGAWRRVPGLGRVITKAIREHGRRKWREAREAQSAEVFDALVRDPDFWRRFEPGDLPT